MRFEISDLPCRERLFQDPIHRSRRQPPFRGVGPERGRDVLDERFTVHDKPAGRSGSRRGLQAARKLRNEVSLHLGLWEKVRQGLQHCHHPAFCLFPRREGSLFLDTKQKVMLFHREGPAAKPALVNARSDAR